MPSAPTFYPTEEEFKDPFTYIESISPHASQFGICRIVPPAGWNPPFALERGTDGRDAGSFKFMTRKQFTSHLCMRAPRSVGNEEGEAAASAAQQHEAPHCGSGGGGRAGMHAARMGRMGRMDKQEAAPQSPGAAGAGAEAGAAGAAGMDAGSGLHLPGGGSQLQGQGQLHGGSSHKQHSSHHKSHRKSRHSRHHKHHHHSHHHEGSGHHGGTHHGISSYGSYGKHRGSTWSMPMVAPPGEGPLPKTPCVGYDTGSMGVVHSLRPFKRISVPQVGVAAPAPGAARTPAAMRADGTPVPPPGVPAALLPPPPPPPQSLEERVALYGPFMTPNPLLRPLMSHGELAELDAQARNLLRGPCLPSIVPGTAPGEQYQRPPVSGASQGRRSLDGAARKGSTSGGKGLGAGGGANKAPRVSGTNVKAAPQLPPHIPHTMFDSDEEAELMLLGLGSSDEGLSDLGCSETDSESSEWGAEGSDDDEGSDGGNGSDSDRSTDSHLGDELALAGMDAAAAAGGRMGVAGQGAGGEDDEGAFGHAFFERKQTLKSFTAYSEWARDLHFRLLPRSQKLRAGCPAIPELPPSSASHQNHHHATPSTPSKAGAAGAADKWGPGKADAKLHGVKGGGVSKVRGTPGGACAAAGAATSKECAGGAAGGAGATKGVLSSGCSGPGGLSASGKRIPSVDEMEAEFWRMVEMPVAGRVVETLYGSDLDSGRWVLGGEGGRLPRACWPQAVTGQRCSFPCGLGFWIRVHSVWAQETHTLHYTNTPQARLRLPAARVARHAHRRAQRQAHQARRARQGAFLGGGGSRTGWGRASKAQGARLARPVTDTGTPPKQGSPPLTQPPPDLPIPSARFAPPCTGVPVAPVEHQQHDALAQLGAALRQVRRVGHGGHGALALCRLLHVRLLLAHRGPRALLGQLPAREAVDRRGTDWACVAPAPHAAACAPACTGWPELLNALCQRAGRCFSAGVQP